METRERIRVETINKRTKKWTLYSFTQPLYATIHIEILQKEGSKYRAFYKGKKISLEQIKSLFNI